MSGDAEVNITSAEFAGQASASDFAQLRLVQLREACRRANLEVSGTKSDLAKRLEQNGNWSREAVLSLRQAFAGARQAPSSSSSSRSKAPKGPKDAEPPTGGGELLQAESKVEPKAKPKPKPKTKPETPGGLGIRGCRRRSRSPSRRRRESRSGEDLPGASAEAEPELPDPEPPRGGRTRPSAASSSRVSLGSGGGGSSGSSPRGGQGGISDAELRRLLWALGDGQLSCQGCQGPIQQRNGRFGLFLCCGARPSCGQMENLAKACLRLPGEGLPVRLILELEDLQTIRLHAQGARDCACLRAWAAEAGLALEAPARPDWEKRLLTKAAESCRLPSSSSSSPSAPVSAGVAADALLPGPDKDGVDFAFGDAGLGLGSGLARGAAAQTSSLSGEERVGFLFPVAEKGQVLERLKEVLAASAAATALGAASAFGQGVRLEDLPMAAVEFLEQKARANGKAEPSRHSYWAAQILDDALGNGWRNIGIHGSRSCDGSVDQWCEHASPAQLSEQTATPTTTTTSTSTTTRTTTTRTRTTTTEQLPRTGHELLDSLRRCRCQGRLLWEWEIMGVAALVSQLPMKAGPEAETLLDWASWAQTCRASGRASGTEPIEAPATLMPETMASEEASRLWRRALTRAPQLQKLRPFQHEGVQRALQLGGRCLIADEMGCGKSPQALGVVAAYDLWPVLLICPASMRLAWAEELEQWLPSLLQPRHLHIVFSSNDMLPQSRSPGSLGDMRVCIVSFSMARLLHENLSRRNWAVCIVDESHCLRSVGGRPGMATQAVLDLLQPLPRVLFLSGTPSASNYLDVFTQANLLCPGFLGRSWHEFVATYDDPTLAASGHLVPGRCRRGWQLALLLREAVMLRRRKAEVLAELPPKRRRLLRLALSAESKEAAAITESEAAAMTDYERSGLLKTAAAESWLIERLEQSRRSGEKAVVFAHHIRVLDRLCRTLESQFGSTACFVRIDGSTLPLTRQALLSRFRQSEATSPFLAIIGVTACAVGVDLSAASLAVFMELPPDASWLCQAEDRLHRRGQKRAVDVVLLIAHDTGVVKRCRKRGTRWSGAEVQRCCEADAYRWRSLCRRVVEVAALHDGPAALVPFPTCSPQTSAPYLDTKRNETTIEDQEEVSEGFPLDRQGDRREIADECSHQTVATQLAQAGSLATPLDIRFELSPYTSRLHVFLGHTPLGVSFLELCCHSSLMGLAAEFRASWMGLAAYQQLLARGVAHTATSLLTERPLAPGLSGSRDRFVLRRHSSTDADEIGASDLPRCEVRVDYVRGRLSGQTLTFLQPIRDVSAASMVVDGSHASRRHASSEGKASAKHEPERGEVTAISNPNLLCMECLALIDMAAHAGGNLANLELLPEAIEGPAGERVMYRASSSCSEERLFCTGSCRARYFGKRNGGSLRRQLFELELGICQSCGLDCHKTWQALVLTAATPERRAACLADLAPRLAADSGLVARIVEAPRLTEGMLWQADHVVPVWAGGGVCGLENLQTLCAACHRAKTKAEAGQRSTLCASDRPAPASALKSSSVAPPKQLPKAVLSSARRRAKLRRPPVLSAQEGLTGPREKRGNCPKAQPHLGPQTTREPTRWRYDLRRPCMRTFPCEAEVEVEPMQRGAASSMPHRRQKRQKRGVEATAKRRNSDLSQPRQGLSASMDEGHSTKSTSLSHSADLFFTPPLTDLAQTRSFKAKKPNIICSYAAAAELPRWCGLRFGADARIDLTDD
ncbi:unnamed protein product [Polarella glacialis]|uniref:DNA annealing helicase and endonuclease ZRANB3 n=1 Tax=Polarella glacialis TaxID=89957 RepID=A0A813ETK0_POLGL|nr:unnamed protein product [Polarella glacialis]